VKLTTRKGGKIMNAQNIISKLNPDLEVVAFPGHFATRHSHNNHYIDITRMKHEARMAREAAITLAQRYTYEKGVDTIVCLDGSEIIGAFLARHLASNDFFSVNKNKSINIITPEYDSNLQLIFRDNLAPMIVDKDILILISTVNSGATVNRAVECVLYYGGVVQGIASIFSTQDSVEGIPVYSLFSAADVPGYATYPHKKCPLCEAGQKIDALSNRYGFSKLF